MCYLAERGRCAVKAASINRELIKLGSAAALPPWDGGVVDPPKNMSPSIFVAMSNLVVLRQRM